MQGKGTQAMYSHDHNFHKCHLVSLTEKKLFWFLATSLKYVGNVHIAAMFSFPDERKRAWLQGDD